MAWRLVPWPAAEAQAPRGGEGFAAFAPLEEPWAARTAPPRPWPVPLYFLDGREQVEALVAEGRRLALLGCLAVGAVAHEGRGMRLLEPRVRRVAVGLEAPLALGELRYEPFPLDLPDPTPLDLLEGLRRARAALEADFAQGLPGGLLVVDGPVRTLREGPLMGYIKTHWARYLPEAQEPLLAALRPGERTPAFRLRRGGLELASWYLRLPFPPEGAYPPWAGLLRLETPLGEEVLELADLSLSLFPALASHPVKDPRAPQNLLPVGGLEQALARRMGDRRVVGRILARHLGGA